MKYVVLPKKTNVYGYCHASTGDKCNECTLCRDQNSGGDIGRDTDMGGDIIAKTVYGGPPIFKKRRW